MERRALTPLDLIKTAESLIVSKSGKPTQANLRRATSPAYYALFHCLARSCANLLVGTPGSNLSKPAWKQVYRALEHGAAKNACRDQEMMKKFPKEIEDFANTFVRLQTRRHLADYDPAERFFKSAAIQDIEEAKYVISELEKVSVKDRRAFAAYVLLKTRK